MSDDDILGQVSLFGEPPKVPPKTVPVRPYKRKAPERQRVALDPKARRAAQAKTAKATTDAIDTVDAHADEEWKGVALACVRTCATQLPEFSADEVWLALEAFPDLGTHEPAALGPVFLKAAKNGWISNSGRRRKRSIFSQRHRELTLWTSHICEGPPPSS